MPDLGLAERIERIEAHLAIQQLAIRYAMAVDARDMDRWLGCFRPDVDMGRHGTGREALRRLAVPSEYGGDGFGLTELEVVLEEMGAALLSSPFFGTVVLAAQALLASGDEAACARYLPGIAAGETIATLAAAEGNASWDRPWSRRERSG